MWSNTQEAHLIIKEEGLRGSGCSYLGWCLAAGSSEEVGVKIRGPLLLDAQPLDR